MIRQTLRRHRRKLLFSLLILVVLLYAMGTGFAFFYRLWFVLVLLTLVGYAWAWFNLRGISVRLTRLDTRGQVGGYLEGLVQMVNRTRMPKSWLEVVEETDLPDAGGRTIALVRGQQRAFRIATYLARRGVYRTGRIRVTARDPFGMFRLSRTFLNEQQYTVLPLTVPLPDLDNRFASLPSDTGLSRRTMSITPESSGVREYNPGDGWRRIHWPYTARMNKLMVKEFDIGVSAQAWVLLDMERRSHVGAPPDNTEELSVTVAASLIHRLEQSAVPVGLAANASAHWMLKPDRRPAQLGMLMETLAAVQADGSSPLERFIFDLRPHLSGFNTLMVVTPSRRTEWAPVLVGLRRQGVNVAVCYVDSTSFVPLDSRAAPGATGQVTAEFLAQHDIPLYLVRQGEDLNRALSSPLITGIQGAAERRREAASAESDSVASTSPVTAD